VQKLMHSEGWLSNPKKWAAFIADLAEHMKADGVFLCATRAFPQSSHYWLFVGGAPCCCPPCEFGCAGAFGCEPC
jgi:hypothetical protein